MPSDILSKGASRRLSRPRQKIYTELRRRGMSYKSIGHVMGRDHTTVIHGIKKIFDNG